MTLTFKILHTTDGLRSGLLRIGKGVAVKTPSMILSVPSGCFAFPHLTPDNLDRTLEPHNYVGFLIPAESLLSITSSVDSPSKDKAKLRNTKSGVINNGESLVSNSKDPVILNDKHAQSSEIMDIKLSSFHGYDSQKSVVVAFKEYEYYFPSKAREFVMRNGADWISFIGNHGVGHFHFTSNLPSLLQRWSPDLFVIPTDHHVITESTNVSHKTRNRSLLRSKHYCALSKKLAPEWDLCPTIISDSVDTGDDYLLDESEAMVTIIGDLDLNRVSSATVKFRAGPLDPSQIIIAAHKGYDLFESTFAVSMAEAGKAILLDLDSNSYHSLDLNDAVYFDALSIISESCKCISCCQGYTKSYIHHLLLSKEMLAGVLLTSHNLFQYRLLFDHLQSTL